MKGLHGCTCKADFWTAVLDKIPLEKPRLTVKGTCTCATGGFETSMVKAKPQGNNQKIMLLRLVTEPPFGVTNQLVTDYELNYSEKDYLASPASTGLTAWWPNVRRSYIARTVLVCK
jgi:hypothetical protein